MADVFGEIVAPWNVERAVLGVLETWMPAYLLNLETKNSFQAKHLGRTPKPSGYRGSLDWQSVKQEWLPAVIVVANPTGEPSRQSTEIIQGFEVEIGCVVLSEEGDDPEGAARMRAGMFATAVMGCLVPRGDLDGFAAEETVLTGSPEVVFFDDDERKIAVGVTKWAVYAQILDPNAGPVTIKEVDPEGPYPEDPEVLTDRVTTKAVPISEEV